MIYRKTILILLTCSSLLLSCEKQEEEINLDVELYIQLLKSNQYDSMTLPAFTSEDIPALLEYRMENQIITDFPHNPISSLYAPECELGIYVLWTIESIRAVAIDSENLILRFPSQNPIVALRNAEGSELIDDEISHAVIAEAYYNWWQMNKRFNFENFKDIDPLSGTDYKWH